VQGPQRDRSSVATGLHGRRCMYGDRQNRLDRVGTLEGVNLLPKSTDAWPLTNAEMVQLQVRAIAIETVLAVLLAEVSEHQLQLVREVSAYISPRCGVTPLRLTIHAAARRINHHRWRRSLAKPPSGPGTQGCFACMKPCACPTRSSVIRLLTWPCTHEQR
jgi:hypothetical protein